MYRSIFSTGKKILILPENEYRIEKYLYFFSSYITFIFLIYQSGDFVCLSVFSRKDSYTRGSFVGSCGTN